MREKLEELARLLEAAKIGTLEVEYQTVYSLENGCNDVWFGVNIKGNHPNHAARRVAAAQALAAIHNSFPDLLEYVRELEGERDEAIKQRSLARMADCADELLAARDARMKREGAAEWLEKKVAAVLAENPNAALVWLSVLEQEAQRLREGE